MSSLQRQREESVSRKKNENQTDKPPPSTTTDTIIQMVVAVVMRGDPYLLNLPCARHCFKLSVCADSLSQAGSSRRDKHLGLRPL